MHGQTTTAQEWLDNGGIESRYPGLKLASPCTAEWGDVPRGQSPCCCIIQSLSEWNRALFYGSFQLQELKAPGELSLLRIAPRDQQTEQHGRDARLLFHALLSQHLCVVSVDLDEALIEGSGLGECRERVLSVLRQNTSLRTLNLGSLFSDYRFLQEDVFAAISTTTQLQELVISATAEAVPCLVDLLCSLLYTVRLTTLSIAGISFYEQDCEPLLDALQSNRTVVDLSLHCSILRSRNSADAFDFAQATVSSLSVSLKGLKPENCASFFFVAPVIESLKTISVSGVALDELLEVCRTVDSTRMSEKVRFEEQYLVSSEALGLLHEFREQVCHIILSSFHDPSVDAFRNDVQLVCSWYNLATLRLDLSQATLDDFATMYSLCGYLNATTALRKLTLSGCDKPDLSGCLPAENGPHSLLLGVVFSNEGLRTVQVSQIRLGDINLHFVADAVICNETLCGLDISSWDNSENDLLVRILADGIQNNLSLLRLRLPNSDGGDTEAEGRADIEAVLSRNVGYVTCAAHFVACELDTRRCMLALQCISKSRALIDRVQELAQVDETQATQLVLVLAA
ncbi:hypothetical protein HPB50_026090 [Hyalomma asiaticum]|uniref:Uncharacterized protein n=1 Tax=Hyalomma asiaticum TaxID=266040 RepID=A0ACB7TC57_HYAAI|nr:hypothetical protein HPB50_026090 [Hyalomma asiaticum]